MALNVSLQKAILAASSRLVLQGTLCFAVEVDVTGGLNLIWM